MRYRINVGTYKFNILLKSVHKRRQIRSRNKQCPDLIGRQLSLYALLLLALSRWSTCQPHALPFSAHSLPQHAELV